MRTIEPLKQKKLLKFYIGLQENLLFIPNKIET